jgi:mono/diheme cytochrome c family protein
MMAASVFAQGAAGRRGGGGGGMPPAPDQAAVDRGQKLFSANCSFCHGRDANGGPDLIRSVLANHDEKGNLIGPVILNGRPDKGMPKFNMTPAQIQDIVAFIAARNRYVRYRQLYQVNDAVVAGDTKAGQAYFIGAGHCSTCHSPTGDLAHIATKFEPEALIRRFLYPQGRGGRGGAAPDPRAQSTVTVTLPSGQAFSGPLRHLDEFTVSMNDAAGDYHTWERDKVKVELHDPLAAHADLLGKYSDDDIHNLLAYLETLK